MSTTERDYYEVLGVPRNARRAGDQEGVPQARARAASGRLRRTRTPRCASARSPRPTRRSRTPRRGSSTTATATPACARAASSRRSFDLGTFGDLFCAFFGEDLFGGRRGAAAAARGADVVAEVEIDARRGRARASRSTVPLETRRHLPHLPRRRRRARLDDRSPAPAAAARASCSRSRAAIFGEFVRQVACPECNGSRPPHRAALRDVPAARAARSRSAGSRSRSRPASTTASASASPARATPAALGGRAGRRLRPGPRPLDDDRFVREGNDIFSQVDLTIVQAALGATVAGRDARRHRASSSSSRAHSRARCACCAGKGMPVLQGFGRGDHRVLVNVTVPRRLTRRAAAAARGVRGALATTTPITTTQGFFEKLKNMFH